MSDIKAELEGSSIILVGDFNPKIFQPAWFAAQGLIRNEEAKNAEIQIIHQAVVDFSLDWLKIQVNQDRFAAATHQKPYFGVLKDLVVGSFRILRHTPIRMMGLNLDVHYPLLTEDRWHALGHKLTPKDMWQKILEKPGMTSLSIMGNRTDEYKGRILVKVEPSRKVQYGVYISINDHYELREKEQEPALGCDEIIDILAGSWEASISKSTQIAEKIWEEANGSTEPPSELKSDSK